MQDLASVIDVLYTTASDVERRETMARLTAYFASPSAWSSLLNLFAVALSSPLGSANDQKRRQRICFFAGNALYTKIRKENLTTEAANALTKGIYELMVAQSMASGSIMLRDPGAELMGTATTRRLVLCLATLALRENARLSEYLHHAVLLLGSANEPHACFLALEMLLAVANPLNEDQDTENDTFVNTPEWLSPNIREASSRVLEALEAFLNNLPAVSNGTWSNALLLETIRAWLVALGSAETLRVRLPKLFRFCVESLAVESRAESLRAASGVYAWLVDTNKQPNGVDMTVKDALLDGLVLSRARFAERAKAQDDDSCHAISMVFSKVSEGDVDRIARGRCTHHGAIIDYGLEILSHQSRSSVARNTLDFFLCIQDVPTDERSTHLNLPFFLRLLAQLVLSCEVTEEAIPSTPEEEDSGDDVLIYRSSSDGPRDLLASIYGMLAERYVHELVAIVASSDFTFLRAEAALFALRCASKEICSAITRREAASLQHQRLALLDLLGRFLRVSFRNQIYFRSGLCATIADFSPVLHLLDMDLQPPSQGGHIRPDANGSSLKALSAVAINLEYVLKNLEDPMSDALLENRACFALLRLCSRHAKTLAPYLETVFTRVMGPTCRVMNTVSSLTGDAHRSAYQLALVNRRALAEALSRLCALHAEPPSACRNVLEPLLARVNASRGDALELQTLAGLIKYFPPDTPKVVEVTSFLVWPLLEHVFAGSLGNGRGTVLSETQMDAVCELVVSVFFCCSSTITAQALDQCLNFIAVSFSKKPLICLAVCAGKAVELFCASVLTKEKCTALLLSLVDRPERFIAEEAHDCIPPVLETIRRSFLFAPEAVLGCEARDSARICDFVFKSVLSEERETIREASLVVVDLVTRTRGAKNLADQTRWTAFGQVFDSLAWETGTILNLTEHVALNLLHGNRSFAIEPLSDLLFALLRAYPGMRVPSWNGTLEHAAAVSTSKEAFRQFVTDRISARASSSSASA